MSVVPVTLRNSFFTDNFFQSSWEEFEKIKKDMLKESRDFWEKAEKNRKEVKESMEKGMQASNTNSGSIHKYSTASSSERKSSQEENGTSIKDRMNKVMKAIIEEII